MSITFKKSEIFPLVSSASFLALSGLIMAGAAQAQTYAINDGSIGGRIWLDENQDGLQSQDLSREPSFFRAPVRILNTRGQEVARTYSDRQGRYQFDGLPNGRYRIQFAKSRQCQISPQNVDNNRNDLIDSDGNPRNGLTRWIRLNKKYPANFSTDVGYVCGSRAPVRQTSAEAKNDSVVALTGEPLVIDVLKNDRFVGQPTISIVEANVPGDVFVRQQRIVILNSVLEGDFTIRYELLSEDGSRSEAEIELSLLPDPQRQQLPSDAFQESPEPKVEQPENSTFAADDSVTTFIGDQQLNIDILENDLPLEAVDRIRIIDADIPGQVFLNRNNQLVIRDLQEEGTFSLTYELMSTDGSSDIATVNVLVEPAPNTELAVSTIAEDDSVRGLVGERLIVNVLENDRPSEQVADLVILDSSVPSNLYITESWEIDIENPQFAGEFFMVYGVESTSGSRDIARVEVLIAENTSDRQTTDENPVNQNTLALTPEQIQQLGLTPEQVAQLNQSGVTTTNGAASPSKIATTAEDDTIEGKTGEKLSINILDNDAPSDAVKDVNLIDSSVPGTVNLTDDFTLEIADDTDQAGTFEVIYELVSSSGSLDRATVTIKLNEEPQTPFSFIDPSTNNGCTLTITNPYDEKVQVQTVSAPAVYQVFESIEAGETKTVVAPANYDPQQFSIVLRSVDGGHNPDIWHGIPSPKCGSVISGDRKITTPKFSAKRNVPKTNPRTIYGCATPFIGTDIKIVRVAETSAAEFSPYYRLYNTNKQLIGDVSISDRAQPDIARGYLRFQWGSEMISHISLPAGDVVGYVSRLSDSGVESPALACTQNRDSTPIALDINQDGEISRIDGRFIFDLDADGQKDALAQWFGKEDGILINTRIKGDITGEHLFGDMGAKYLDGFAKLSMHDVDNNELVEGKELADLGIWIDANSNARLDEGELSSLSKYGITKLSTQHQYYFSKAQLDDGLTMLMEDVWLPLIPPSKSEN